MPEISLASLSRLVKAEDPNIRIGNQTKEELRESVEEYAKRIATLAISTARAANRNTVLPQDIATAREQLMVGMAFHRDHISR